MNTNPFPRGYLPTLDGWRAVAILLVILAHAIDSLLRAYGKTISWLIPFSRHGGLGVSLFFGISGVLITSRLLEERSVRGRIDLKKFYIRRAFRILPPLLLLLVSFCLLAKLVQLPVSWADRFRALLFASNYGPEPNWYLKHTWSLSVEEHFYILWPVLLVGLGVSRAIRLAFGASLVITLWRIADIHYAIVPGYIGISPWRSDTTLDFLLLGAAVGCLLNQPTSGLRLKLFLTPRMTLGLLASVVVAIILLDYFPHLAHPVRSYQAAAIPLVLAGTILNPLKIPGWVLENVCLRRIGQLSYSLYLWQQLFIVPGDSRVASLGRLQEWPLNLFATFGCAILSYYFVERPLVKVGHKLARPVSEGHADLPAVSPKLHG